MSFIIREGEKSDMPAALNLIKELAHFEKESNAVEVTVDELVKDGFGKTPLFKIFVAEIAKEIVGIALFYPRYSTWKGLTAHLEDLIVQEAFRGRGTGRQLLEAAMQWAESIGAQRLHWEVLDWNQPAIDFYEGVGAQVLRDWYPCRLSAADIAVFPYTYPRFIESAL